MASNLRDAIVARMREMPRFDPVVEATIRDVERILTELLPDESPTAAQGPTREEALLHAAQGIQMFAPAPELMRRFVKARLIIDNNDLLTEGWSAALEVLGDAIKGYDATPGTQGEPQAWS